MAESTRVLVTNALHILPRCDHIYVCAGGTFAESGTYDELTGRDDSLLVAMGASSGTPTGTPRSTTSDKITDGSKDVLTAMAPQNNKANTLVKAEDRK